MLWLCDIAILKMLVIGRPIGIHIGQDNYSV